MQTTVDGINKQIERHREHGNPTFVISYIDHNGIGRRHAFDFEPYEPPTYWEFRWLNPNNETVPASMLEWQRVELRTHHQGDIMNAVEELQGYRGSHGKRLYQLRRVYCEYVEEPLV